MEGTQPRCVAGMAVTAVVLASARMVVAQGAQRGGAQRR